MPTFVSGDVMVVEIDNGSGTPVDVSATCESARVDANIGIGSFNTLGSRYTNKTEGKYNASGSINVYTSTGATEGYALIAEWVSDATAAGKRTVSLYMPDKTAGSFSVTGEAYPASFQLINQSAGGNGEPASQPLNLEFDGQVTWGIVS